jgi:cell division protein FtsB
VKARLEEARAENVALEEENGRLQSDVVRLNMALAEAALEVYSLNKKLDAIFKPESGED